MTRSVGHPVVHVGETAGVPDLLRRGLEDLGFPTVGVTLDVPAAHSGDLRKVLTGPKRLIDARRALARLNPSLLHIHYATTALWYLDSHPLVVHCHGSDVRDVRGPRRSLLDFMFGRADLVLYSTPDLRGHVPGHARYLPNPVDCDLFDEVDTRPQGDVLVMAAATEVKGIDRITAILGSLSKQRPGTSVTAINMGDRAGNLEAAGATLIPRVEQDQLPGLISAHRVVIGQQRLTALGTAELQVMACRRPVIGVANPLIYPEPPPVITPSEPVGAASTICELLSDPSARDEFGQEARRWVVANHGVEAAARQLAALYAQLGVVPDQSRSRIKDGD